MCVQQRCVSDEESERMHMEQQQVKVFFFLHLSHFSPHMKLSLTEQHQVEVFFFLHVETKSKTPPRH